DRRGPRLRRRHPARQRAAGRLTPLCSCRGNGGQGPRSRGQNAWWCRRLDRHRPPVTSHPRGPADAAMTAPGPALLGRGVVVDAGDPVPAPWRGAPVVTVDDAVLDTPAGAPSPVVDELHRAWAERRPVVV